MVMAVNKKNYPVMKENHRKGLKKNAVIVFLKAPEQGRVKTRLSKSLDDAFVLDLYKGFIEDTLEILEIKADQFICFWPPEKKAALKIWLGEGYAYFFQRGKDLGERMSNAFYSVFEKGYDSVILIGTDIPELSRDLILRACKVLQTTDAVIGPTNDGGYYLIGFQRDGFSETVFQNIDWSTHKVFLQTLAAMTKLSIQYEQLPSLNDIDTPEDLTALVERVKKGVKAGPRTLRHLERYET